MIVLLAKNLLRLPLQRNTRTMHSPAKEEEIQIDPEPVNHVNLNATTTTPKWRRNLDELKQKYHEKFQQGEATKSSIPEDNGNLNDTELLSKQRFYLAPIINKEALCTDVAVKTIVADLEVVDEKLNLGVKKSEALAVEWKQHISKLDAYIESLKSLPWKKLLTYGACMLTILGFLWKMGMLRSIPSFASNVAGLGLDAGRNTMTSNTVGQDPSMLPKPSMDSIKNFMESPITPGAFLMGAGGIAITMIVLKGVVWVLRKTGR